MRKKNRNTEKTGDWPADPADPAEPNSLHTVCVGTTSRQLCRDWCQVQKKLISINLDQDLPICIDYFTIADE